MVGWLEEFGQIGFQAKVWAGMGLLLKLILNLDWKKLLGKKKGFQGIGWGNLKEGVKLGVP